MRFENALLDTRVRNLQTGTLRRPGTGVCAGSGRSRRGTIRTVPLTTLLIVAGSWVALLILTGVAYRFNKTRDDD